MSDLGFVLIGCLVAVHGALRAAWSPCGQSMLASLTPLSERARAQSWRVTVLAFGIGAIGAGTISGLLWSGLGSLFPAGSWRVFAVLGVLVVALAIDATPLRRRMPLTARQVNEDWMARYRGWVYGFGYGAQLGFGFITLVACAAIYATFAIELLSGSLLAGAVIGAAFGATKALTISITRAAQDGSSLMTLHRRLLRLEPGAQRALVAAEAVALFAVAVAL